MDSEKIVHFQTTYMKKYRQTYCGRKNISDKVQVTDTKHKVTCSRCRKYLGLE